MFPPFETPYKVAAAGLLKQPGKDAGSSERLRPLKSPVSPKGTARPIDPYLIKKNDTDKNQEKFFVPPRTSGTNK